MFNNTRPAVDRISDICSRAGFSRSQYYVLAANGLWTRPIAFGKRMSGAPATETDALIQARIAGKSEIEIRALVVKLEAARREAA